MMKRLRPPTLVGGVAKMGFAIQERTLTPPTPCRWEVWGGLLAGLLAALLSVSAAFAEFENDLFRCRDKNLISLGASMYEVRHLCGEPDLEMITNEDAPSYATWVYDMGRTDYIYYLEFKAGRLKKIVHRGERGFK